MSHNKRREKNAADYDTFYEQKQDNNWQPNTFEVSVTVAIAPTVTPEALPGKLKHSNRRFNLEAKRDVS